MRRRWLCCDKLLFLYPDSDWSRCGCGGGSRGHLKTRHGGLWLEVKLSPLGLLAAEAVKQRRDGHRGEGGGLLGERDAGQGQAEHQTLLDRDVVSCVLCTVNTTQSQLFVLLTFNILPMLHSQVMSLNWRQALVRAVTVIIIGISVQCPAQPSLSWCLKPSLRPRFLKVTSSALCSPHKDSQTGTRHR